MSASFDVQRAVFAALETPLAALTPPCAVYDAKPDKAPFPFVEITRWRMTPDNEFAADLTQYQATFTVWSEYKGQKQVHEILDAIKAALDDAMLTPASGTWVRCDMDSSDTVRDADGETYMGQAIYTILIRESG